MRDNRNDNEGEGKHTREHGAEAAGTDRGVERLKKMTEYWISHNEEHARSYRLWAGHALEAGYVEPGNILEELASEMVNANERLRKVIRIIDSVGPGADRRRGSR